MKPNILLIGPFPDPINGQSIANEMLKNGLINNGYKIDFVDTNSEKKFNNLSSQGKFNFKKILKSVKPILEGIKKILNKDTKIIYITPAQSYLGFLKYIPFIIASNIKRKPVFIHFHGGFVREMFNSVDKSKQNKLKKYFQKCSGIIVLGESLVEMFKDIIPRESVFVCENGVSNEFFLKNHEIISKFDKKEESKPLEILYLSNLMKTKGILDLLEASVILKNNGFKFNLNIAGNIEPELKGDFKKYENLLQGYMQFHGIVKSEKKRDLLLKSDVFCLPTYYPNEGQPISILEAMAMGCSIITTNQGGIQDIFENKVNGLECFKKNPENLSKAILKIDSKSKKYGFTNYNTAIKSYSETDFVKRIETIILKLDLK